MFMPSFEMLSTLFAPAPGSAAPGYGTRRAEARLQEHRAKWDSAPSADRWTRQRQRQAERRDAKRARAEARIAAHKQAALRLKAKSRAKAG